MQNTIGWNYQWRSIFISKFFRNNHYFFLFTPKISQAAVVDLNLNHVSFQEHRLSECPTNISAILSSCTFWLLEYMESQFSVAPQKLTRPRLKSFRFHQKTIIGCFWGFFQVLHPHLLMLEVLQLTYAQYVNVWRNIAESNEWRNRNVSSENISIKCEKIRMHYSVDLKNKEDFADFHGGRKNKSTLLLWEFQSLQMYFLHGEPWWSAW